MVMPMIAANPPCERPARNRATGTNGKTVPAPANNRTQSPPLATDLAQTWLAWQCRMVAGIIRGAIYLPVDAEHIGSPVSIWPGEGEGEVQLVDAATQALSRKAGLVRSQQRYGPGNHRTCDLIACPLLVDNAPVAVVAVMVSTRSEP